jgi:RNA polymerase sigma factor (sigma-70 family)
MSEREDPHPDRTGEEQAVTDLLARARTGDGAAWAELVRRYTPVVQARMRPYRLQEADRHDVAQTAWLRLAENLDRLHTPGHLGGWLATVVARESLRVAQRESRATAGGELLLERLPDRAPGPAERAVAADVATRLWAAVAQLPPTRRALVHALFADGTRPYADIARELGMPIGAIGPTRGRALRALRASLPE